MAREMLLALRKLRDSGTRMCVHVLCRVGIPCGGLSKLSTAGKAQHAHNICVQKYCLQPNQSMKCALRVPSLCHFTCGHL